MRRHVLALALLTAPACAKAGDPAQFKLPAAPVTISDTVRSATDDWDVRVLVPQDSIGTSIDIGRVMPNANGGGLLGDLFIQNRYDNRKPIAEDLTAKADAVAAPVREQLSGFDSQALALATVKAALSRVAWLKANSVAIDRTPAATVQATAPGRDSQRPRALLEIRYEFSPDFTQIRVVTKMLLDQPAGLAWHHVGYIPMVSTVQLKDRSFENRENARRWAANGAAPARQALTMAFSGMEGLIARGLSMTAAQARQWSSRDAEKSFSAGFNGSVLERTPTGGLILWQNALVAVETWP